jgi:hypothetical protein
MGLARFFNTRDTWITTAEESDVSLTGSNFGKDPVLSVFARKHNLVSGSIELGRILIDFPITELSGKIFVDRTIPSSSVQYKLKMFNMQHSERVPSSCELFVYPLTRSWDEGNGTGLTNLNYGWANWVSGTSTQSWVTAGGDFNTSMSASQRFDVGSEDLEVDITQIVNEYLTGTTLSNQGLIIKMGSTEETNSTDYYLKAFHGRESMFVDKLPYIEARWDSSKLKDNRKNFAFNQQNKLYMYNLVRGELANVTAPVYVRIQDAVNGTFARYIHTLTASSDETGIYSCSFTISNTASFSGTFYDIWHSGAVVYMTGNFQPVWLTASQQDDYKDFILNVDNLKQQYRMDEEYRFKVTVKRKEANRTHVGVLKSASFAVDREYVEKLYYSVVNNETGEIVVPFGTGSNMPYTQCGYDANGNFFDLHMRSFVPGFVYKFLFKISWNKYDERIYDDKFLFKVV